MRGGHVRVQEVENEIEIGVGIGVGDEGSSDSRAEAWRCGGTSEDWFSCGRTAKTARTVDGVDEAESREPGGGILRRSGGFPQVPKAMGRTGRGHHAVAMKKTICPGRFAFALAGSGVAQVGRLQRNETWAAESAPAVRPPTHWGPGPDYGGVGSGTGRISKTVSLFANRPTCLSICAIGPDFSEEPPSSARSGPTE